jgi:hypothetical protein
VGYQYGKEYGGHLAACMIMSCIANRVRLGWSPNLITAIANIPKFAATTDLPPYEIPSMWDPAFIRLLSEVGAIAEGLKDHANGATYWCDTRRIDTPFFVDKILKDPTHRRVAEMNSLACFI